jgi:hypothetical protein
MNEERRLDTLLNSLPLERLPVGLTARIMGEIRPMPTFAPFRLNLSDILLALAFTVLMVVGLYYAIIPLLHGAQPVFELSRLQFNTNNLTFAFLFLLELLLGSSIYLSIVED